MKKTYFPPASMSVKLEVKQILATSNLNPLSDEQIIVLTDEEYDEEFNIKKFSTNFWDNEW